MADQTSAPSNEEIIQQYVEGWLKTREDIIDDIKDSLAFSASLTALATGSVGLVGIRAAFSIERTWLNPTLVWWVLFISAISLLFSLFLGLRGSSYGYAVLKNYLN